MSVVRTGGAAYLHKKSWNYTREVKLLFMNNPGGGRRMATCDSCKAPNQSFMMG